MAHKHIVYMMLADLAGQLRDAVALPRYSSLVEELAIRDSHQTYLAVAHRSWGIAHRLNKEYAEADARLAQALALFDELQARWQIGRTLVEIAELAMAQSDKPGARDHYTRALTEFDSIKAMPDAERTRAALKAFA